MSDQPAQPEPQPEPEPDDTDEARAGRGGPSSHDTAGQFPADEVTSDQGEAGPAPSDPNPPA